MASSTAADMSSGWASPALLEASIFLRDCAKQALGGDFMALPAEDALPPVPAEAMAAALARNMPEPRPSVAELREAGVALQTVMEHQPLLVCHPRFVFGTKAYAPSIAALSEPSLLALVEACDRASLPAEVQKVVTACLAQHSASLPRAAFQTLVAARSPRFAELLRQWWADTCIFVFGPVIKGDLVAWRAAHPDTMVANVRGRHDLSDADFAALSGVKALCIRDCSQTAITDKAFKHLEGIHMLDMSGCNQDTITDAAFTHLKGIQTLHMSGCNQRTITDAAFANLTGIYALDMSGCHQLNDAAFDHLCGICSLNMRCCNQPTITDAAFVHLANIHTLDISGCSQRAISDAAFAHLTGIKFLYMSHCSQPSITDEAFSHLAGIHKLDISGCTTISDAAFAHLSGIHTLNVSGCNQPTITNAAFEYLAGIHTLDMSDCNQATITSAAFAHLRGINTLDMSGCNQPEITDAAFEPLAGIHALDMGCCKQATITSAAFSHLRGISTLVMMFCNQPAISDTAFEPLAGIHALNMSFCNQPTITDAAFVHLAGISRLEISGTQFEQHLFPAQHLLAAELVGLDQSSVPIKWLLSAKRPLSREALSDPAAGKILEGVAAIADTLPLSQPLIQFLRDYLAAVFAAMSDFLPMTAEHLEATHYWLLFIDTCGERVCSQVLVPIFAKPPLPLSQLAHAKDSDGRTAYSISKAYCRALFDNYLHFCGRYELHLNDPRNHSSATSRVMFAYDTSRTCTSRDVHVVLKFMRQEHFDREVRPRQDFNLSDQYVIRILREHTPASNPELAASAAALLGLDVLGFDHVVVLPAGEKMCSAIIASEHALLNWPSVTHFIIQSMASSLAHMHEKGVIHGDVKPRNIVRSGGGYLLIDLDAAVADGEAVSGKASTAFAAPELFAHIRSTAAAVAAAAAAPEALIAHPSLDMWSLGVTLYYMLQRAPLFHSNESDSLVRAEETTRLDGWTPQNQADAVKGIEDRTARALVFDLLHRDPTKRLSARQVLQHPYITQKPFTSRLGGEVPTYDVFLSYRVASEGPSGNDLAQKLYDALTKLDLKVWWDKKCIADGKQWKEEFCTGAAASRMFVPLLSSAAFGSKAPTPWSNLERDSFSPPGDVDNVLLEHRLAVELQHRGYFSHIFPVFVEEFTPVLQDFPITAIENELEEKLRTAGLSLRFTKPQSVADIWKAMAKNRQGVFLKPFQDTTTSQVLGEAELALDGEGALPPVSGAALAAALALQLPEPRPTAAELLEAGAALQAVMEQQPLPVCDPARVFWDAPYAPAIAALPLPTLLVLCEACDLASLPVQIRGIATACLAQRSVRQPRAAFQAEVAARSLRSSALLRQWWADTYTGSDFGPVIQGSLAAWRSANPHTLVASVRGRRDLTDADFAALRGVQALDMSECCQRSITDAAFVHLAGIHTLVMDRCNQFSVTDAAFAHLRGICTLHMSGCNQPTITDAAFVYLAGVHKLLMEGCNQHAITDAAFVHLSGIHELNMMSCNQPTITDAAFLPLAGIHTLNMCLCNQSTITDQAFTHLAGIHTLNMAKCNQPTITDAAFVHLVGIHTLIMGSCNQPTITDAAFAHLAGIHTLDMRLCSQPTITDAAFAHLTGIHTLNMMLCKQRTITDAAFVHLAGIHTLYMFLCKQPTITDAAFSHLAGIHTLDMRFCDQPTITDAAFSHLAGIHTLKIGGNQTTITDAAFAHLAGIHTLAMRGCSQATITDAAFAHLRGIHTLDMAKCNQRTITDAAFAHLAGIHTLSIGECNQPTITDAAFVHLAGVCSLDMGKCNQPTITDAAFAHLAGIHSLDMQHCNQHSITDAAFVHLRGIHTLDMAGCNQPAITDAAFAHLTGIHTLNMRACVAITDAAFAHLTGLHTLNMGCCTTITDAAFVHLTGIHTLDMQGCTAITDAAFVHLPGIHTLSMGFCNQPTITDAAFVYLRGIHTLNMSRCRQSTITSAAFAQLAGIHTLDIEGCKQPTITDAAFAHLTGIYSLNMRHCSQPAITDAAFVNMTGIHRLFMRGCTPSAISSARTRGLPVSVV